MPGIAITFPSNPIEGQTYLAQNGFTYSYNSTGTRWERAGNFVRPPKVLTVSGYTPNSGYAVTQIVTAAATIGIDSYKAYTTSDAFPNYTEIQFSSSSTFNTISYATTQTSTSLTLTGAEIPSGATLYVRARQFLGSNASAASTGYISTYSSNPVQFITTSTSLFTPSIVSISGVTTFPVYQIGSASTTLPATVTYTGAGAPGNLQQVDWRVTGPRIPTSTGDIALAEVGVGTFTSATLANALVLAMPFSGAAGVGITNDVNNAIRTASGASAGTTKTVTANGGIGTSNVGIATTTANFYSSAAYCGTGKYATAGTNSDYSFGTGDFTVEAWVYQIAESAYSPIMDIGNHSGTGGILFITRAPAYGGVTAVYSSSSYQSSYILPMNTWVHLAYVRKSGTLNIYANGTNYGSFSFTNNLNDSGVAYIGSSQNYSYYFPGYMQDLKIYKGLAKYTENFTPPLPIYGTISYTTSISNVGVATTAVYQSTGDIVKGEVSIGSSTAAQVANSLVLAMPMNATFGFQDINVAIRGLTSGASAGTAKTVGVGTTSRPNSPSQPYISATNSKWYGSSAYFNKSTSQYAQSISSDFAIGSNDVTIECWINTTDVSTTNGGSHIFQIDSAATNIALAIGQNNIGDVRFLIRNDSATNLLDIYSPAGTINTNTWHHLAATLSGTSGRLFVNGNLVASGTLSGTRTHTGTTAYFGSNAGSRFYGGNLQDLRFYKGLAKYTANFTPPQPICGFTTDISTQTGFTTTSATGALLSSSVGLGTTSTLAFNASTTYASVATISSSSGITTLSDPYAQNLVIALPLANITGAGSSFTNDINTQIRTASLVGGGSTKTITNSGVTTVSVASTTQKWYGNMAYFNNSSTLSFPSLNLETSWTYEAWVYPLTTNVLGLFDTATSVAGVLRNYPDNNIEHQNGSRVAFNMTPNRWSHIAVCFYTPGNLCFDVFVNGNFVGSINCGTSSYTQGSNFYIGSINAGGAGYFNGYLQDVKIYNGLRKYISNFTPPPPMFGDYVRNTSNKIIFTPGSDYVLEAKNTSANSYVTSYSSTRQWGTKGSNNTGLLYDPYATNLVLAIPGGAVGGATTTYDVTGQIKLETPTTSYTDAGITTSPNGSTYTNMVVTNFGVTTNSSVYKYYANSLYFTGGIYARPAGADLGTVFTIETWYYAIDLPPAGNYIRVILQATNADFSLQHMPAGGGFQFYSKGATAELSASDNSAISAGTWNHIAGVRDGSDVRLYINGKLVASATGASGSASSTPWYISKVSNNPDYFLNGYLQDLRVYKGLAKYTTGFQPPTKIYLT
jgi:hypothetical protein